jgi:hypothetical protein
MDHSEWQRDWGFKYHPHRLMRVKRVFVTDAEIQLMEDLFNRKVIAQNLQLHWLSMDKCKAIAAVFHCGEAIRERFATIYESQNPPYNWVYAAGGRVGITEVVWIVEKTFQIESGVSCWASSKPTELGYQEDYEDEEFPHLVPVTFEGIMRLPLEKRSSFMSQHDNFSNPKQREIIGLDEEKINQILALSLAK